MRVGRSLLIVTGTVVVVAALLLSLMVSLPAGLSFLAGCLIGVASLAAVVVRVRLLTGGPAEQRQSARLWAAILTTPYYLLVAGALWALGRHYPNQAPWLLVGYLAILAAFAVSMARGQKPKAATPEADKS